MTKLRFLIALNSGDIGQHVSYSYFFQFMTLETLKLILMF